MKQTLNALLQGNAYPGRGIVLGRSADGRSAVAAYFIMGRSENSRNRVFAPTQDGIRTEPFDPAKVKDPSLILYRPVRIMPDGVTVVTNGDQTDTIHAALLRGESYRSALLRRSFEPDAPNWTPRISGVLRPDGGYALSILKSLEGSPEGCCRFFYEYETPQAGLGHLIHTYECDGDPLPSFRGEPRPAVIDAPDAHAFAQELWQALDGNNRISLFVQYIDRQTLRRDTAIINQNIRQTGGQV